MSREIDERVVSLQLENKQFERNADKSMSTLDKLKDKLNFKAAAKGAENLNAAVKKVDLSCIGQSADRVGLRFSAMYTMADQTFRNIINSAERTATRLASAFTIDPVKTGLSEYETKINSIQVIQSNTRGVNTMDEITDALDELNTYADKTIYNFAQMTSNIGKFVAQGLDVNEATNAVQGMANLAAASGASAEDMARATYQMSQALGGTIRKIDWNSLRNANMATVDLKNTLMDLARVEGIDIDGMIAEKGVFEDTLEEGWLSGQLFTEAMNIYSGVYDEMELKARGFTDEQVANFMDLAANAASAATEVKTFTQLFDVLKETAQSGWTQTWEYIIGDFETAKENLTGLQNYFSDIINGFSDARNFVVKNALNLADPWTKIMEKLEGGGLGKVKEMVDTIGDFTDKLEYFQSVVNGVWMGDYMNADTGRYDLLEQAGYDHRVVQDLVNKGYGYQLTVEDIEESHKKFGLTMEKTAESMKDTTSSTDKMTVALNNLSDEQLENAGLTEEEIKIFRELQRESEKSGKSIEELANKMSTNTGRMLLIDSLKNAWSGLLGIFTAIGNAWREIFPPIGFVQLYNGIEALNKFSKNLRLTDKETGELTETGQNLQRIFRGVFAILDIVTTLVGGGLKIAFKAVGALLNLFGTDVIEVAAWIGDAAVALRDWMDSVLDFEKIFIGLGNFFKSTWKAVNNWIKGLKETDDIPQYIVDSFVNGFHRGVGAVSSAVLNFGKAIVNKIEEIFGIDFSAIFAKISPVIKDITSAFSNWFKTLKGAKSFGNLANMFSGVWSSISNWFAGFKDIKGAGNIAKYIVQGLINGLKEGVKLVIPAIIEIGKLLIDAIKSVLGIHSPSTVFFAIGGFIIAGLVGGLIAGGTEVWDTVKNIGVGCLEAIKGIDWGALLAVATIAGFLLIANKLANALQALASPLEGVSDVLEGFAGIEKSVKNFVNAQAMKTIAISIAIIAGSIAVLSLLNVGKAWSAVGMVVVIVGTLIGALAIINKMDKEGTKSIVNFAILVGVLAAAMLTMALVAKIIAGMDSDALLKGGLGLAAMVGIITLLILVSRIAKKKDMADIGSMLVKMAGALLLLVVVGKLLAGMEWSEMGKAGAGLAGLVGIIALLMLVSKIANTKKIGSMLASMAASMLILVVVAKLIAGMEWSEMGKAAVGMLGLVGIMSLMMLITKIGNAKKVGSMLLQIAGAMAILVIVAKLLVGMEWSEMGKAAAGILGLVGIVAILVAVTKLAPPKQMENLGKTLLAMSLAIGILAIIALLLGLVNPATIWKGIGAVSTLAILMSVMVASTRGAEKCVGNIVALTVAIAVMVGAVAVMSLINPDKLGTATTSLAILMVLFSLMIYSTSKLSGMTGKSLATIIVLTVAVGLMGGLMYMIAKLPWQNSLSAAGGLSLLMLAMTGVLFILDKMHLNLANAVMGIIGLSLIAVPLFLFVAVLATMQGVQNATTNAMALVGLATAMTLLLIPLSLVGALVQFAIPGIIALAVMAVPLILFVGVLAAMQGIDNATVNTMLIITLMTAMTDCLFKISLVAPLAVIAVIAIAALVGVITSFGVLATAIGALVKKFPQLEKFLDTGIPIMVKMAEGLGLMIGKFVSAFAKGVMEILPMFGACLTSFMSEVQGFIDGASKIDERFIIGIGYLTAGILALTVAELITGITALGGAGLVMLGYELSAFMAAATPFFEGISKFGENSVAIAGVKALAETILILTAADVLNGLTSWFTGGTSLADFGKQLAPLGEGLSAFAAKLGEFTPDQIATVSCACEAVKTIAEAAKTLPNEGGWMGKIFGENGLGEFGSQLPEFATDLNGFLTNLGTFDQSKLETVNVACDAIKAIASAASKIPNEGGWAGKIFGENGLGAFSAQLPGTATAINRFITNLGTLDDTHVETVNVACNVIKKISSAAKSLPNEGGWAAKIFGDNSIATFGSKLPGFATNLKRFVNNLAGIAEGASSVDTAMKIVKDVASLSKSNLKGAGKNIDSFGDKMVGFAKNVKKFADKMSEVGKSSFNTAVENVKSVAKLAASIKSDDSKNLKEFGDNLKSLGDKSIDKFIKAFTGDATSKKITSAVSTVVKKFTDALSKKVSSFETAGKDFGAGLVKGIKAKEQAAYDAGFALGQKAVQGEKDGQKSNSPSKLTTQAGKWIGEGLVNGMVKMTNAVYGAGHNLGELATDSISSAVNQISAALSSDIDAQPTITPVLDLSNVTSGANAISGLFSGRRTLTVDTGMVGVVASAMSQRQNGMDNSDVVSSIKALSKDLANMPRESITIDGITYDDGSNIADAVHTLVRAVRIEGRV